MTVAVAPLLPGETLGGKYRIESVLGQGGMGIVVAARHLDLDERVAIKFLLGQPSERAVERFLREARAAVKVKGEHVCRVFDFGRLETGEPYIVMEYLEGTDLARKLIAEGPQPIPRVVGWVIEACVALADAHASGIVHRDLKPANVLVATRPDGSSCVKVLDFGISKLPQVETITSPAAVMGSPIYMSPEQIASARDVDLRSDVWSLGVVMYELLTGTPPFTGDAMLELAVRIHEKEPAPIEDQRPEVPPGLRRAIARCLAKRAIDRYASVAELAVDLAPFAPPEVASLVARLARRTEAAPLGEALAVDAAAPADERGPPLRATFSPVHSTVDRDGAAVTTDRRRRRLVAPLVALGAAVVAVVVVRLSPSTVSVPPEASTRAPPPEASAPGELVPGPSASHRAVDTSAEAGAGEASVMARASAPVSPKALHAPRATAAIARPSAPPTASSASATNSPEAAPGARKKRELDRDDP